MQKPDTPYLRPEKFAEWYALDYFRRTRRLWHYKAWLLGVPIVACLAWLGIQWGFGNNRIYQASPVSPGHLAFDNDCRQCHADSFQTLKRLVPWNMDLRTVSDSACVSCHPKMPIHNEQEVATPGCTSCHVEHRGKPDLRWVADGQCADCHANLQRKDGSACTVISPISQFAASYHPDFRVPGDPGTIRFNHAVHMALANHPPDHPLHSKQFSLACADCHQPESDGRYMKPIRYDSHCIKCHPLIVHNEPAPHVEPAKVREALKQRYSSTAKNNPSSLVGTGDSRPDRPIPGQQRPQPVGSDTQAWAKEQLDSAERALFSGAGTCQFCHLASAPWQPAQLPTYELTKIRPRWFTHSVFSHARHEVLSSFRKVDCAECHEQALVSRKTSDVMMPGMASCQKCHNSWDGPSLGARTDCVQCHRYHDDKKEHLFRLQTSPAPGADAPGSLR